MFEIVDGKPKVLIIEDLVDTAELEVMIAKDVGFDAKYVTDGSLAMDEIKTYRPNIIVLDLDLPGKSGDVIQEEMLLDPQFADIPIIVSSDRLYDPDLSKRYNLDHSKRLENQPKRIYWNHSDVMSKKELLTELTAASGDTYKKIPKELMDHWKKAAPNKLPPFETF